MPSEKFKFNSNLVSKDYNQLTPEEYNLLNRAYYVGYEEKTNQSIQIGNEFPSLVNGIGTPNLRY